MGYCCGTEDRKGLEDKNAPKDVKLSGNEKEKPVFYMYDEFMMQHRDYNYHTEEGKIKEDLPELREDDFVSPEVPFRIKAIHDYLNENPKENPLLS